MKNEYINLLPVGAIVMWYGSYKEIPYGWALCDGQNGTPNLLGRFAIGAVPSQEGKKDSYSWKKTGGSGEISLKANYHIIPKTKKLSSKEFIKNLEVNNEKDNLPPYHAVYYIMRVEQVEKPASLVSVNPLKERLKERLKESIILEDYFNNNNNNWNRDRSLESAEVKNGYMTLEKKHSNGEFANKAIKRTDNFSIETTLKWESRSSSNDDDGFGIIWGQRNASYYYKFDIFANGRYKIDVIESSKGYTTKTTGIIKSKIVKKGQQKNHLKIVDSVI